jgi:membrane-bound serine protease (ClpP class)
VNDAAAYIRTIAGSRGRNQDWAERAVRESVSITEQEALDLNVIDMVAGDLSSLISQLEGKQVTLQGGGVVTLELSGAAIYRNPMTPTENFLDAISDPNIAYLLLSLATLGIIAELSNPGLIFPGVIGAICLLMAFFSLGTLPVNYAGIALILLAIGLLVGEIFTGIGILAAGGIIAMVLGSAILFKGGALFQVSPWLIGITTVFVAGFIVFILSRVIKAQRLQSTTGREELIGKPALVKVALGPEGMVLFRGERWKAVSDEGIIKPGEEVVIDKVENLTLHVSRKKGAA